MGTYIGNILRLAADLPMIRSGTYQPTFHTQVGQSHVHMFWNMLTTVEWKISIQMVYLIQTLD